MTALEIEGIESGLRYDDLKSVFESQASFSPRSNVAQRLRAALDYLDRVVPWVQSLSFDALVRAIYKEYPHMAQNSVFRS